MSRYLVVLNRTTASTRLLAELRRRVQAGPAQFHVLVPATRPHEHLAWSEGAANVQAGNRLTNTLRQLDAAGIGATGSVGDGNPGDAVKQVLQRERQDEIILSTPAAGPSWLVHLDLPHRLARRTRVPVTSIVAPPVGEPAAESAQ
jgi:GABA permease